MYFWSKFEFFIPFWVHQKCIYRPVWRLYAFWLHNPCKKQTAEYFIKMRPQAHVYKRYCICTSLASISLTNKRSIMVLFGYPENWTTLFCIRYYKIPLVFKVRGRKKFSTAFITWSNIQIRHLNTRFKKNIYTHTHTCTHMKALTYTHTHLKYVL